MTKSIKKKNNVYWDSTGIVHNKKLLSDILYPVGSIYLSVSNKNPETIFGGQWIQISGRFLYASNNSKQTGGSNVTGSTVLTIDQIPSHKHTITNELRYSKSSSWWIGGTGGTTIEVNHVETDAIGGGKGHTHSQSLPPYFTVYCWYRTA